jgi:hypothetical protein
MSYSPDFAKFLRTVGRNLRILRRARDLNMETVALDLEMPVTTLEKIEDGEIDWTMETIEMFCIYYDVSIEKLILER